MNWSVKILKILQFDISSSFTFTKHFCWTTRSLDHWAYSLPSKRVSAIVVVWMYSLLTRPLACTLHSVTAVAKTAQQLFSLSSTTMNAHGYVEVSPTEEREAKNAMRGAKLGLGISLLCFTAGYLSTNLTQVSMGPMLPPHATLYAMPRHAMPPCQSNTTTMPLPGKAPSRTTHPPPRHSRSTPLHRPARSLDSRPPPRRRLSSLGRRRLCRT